MQVQFPGGNAPVKQDNPTAHFAGTFVVVGAGKGSTPTAMVVTGQATTPKARAMMPSVPIAPKMPSVLAGQHATLTDALDEMYRVPGSETVITAGVYRGKTSGHMLHRTDYYMPSM